MKRCRGERYNEINAYVRTYLEDGSVDSVMTIPCPPEFRRKDLLSLFNTSHSEFAQTADSIAKFQPTCPLTSFVTVVVTSTAGYVKT